MNIPTAKSAEPLPPIRVREVHYVETPARSSRTENHSQSVHADTRIRVIGGIVAASVTLLAALITAGLCSGTKQSDPLPKPTDPQPPITKVTATFPATKPVESPGSHGGTATPAQIRYMNGLIEKKGWNERRRDDEVAKALGYKRSFDQISKAEASKLIDAWK